MKMEISRNLAQSVIAQHVAADSTPHIQETHLWVEYILCELVEKEMFT